MFIIFGILCHKESQMWINIVNTINISPVRSDSPREDLTLLTFPLWEAKMLLAGEMLIMLIPLGISQRAPEITNIFSLLTFPLPEAFFLRKDLTLLTLLTFLDFCCSVVSIAEKSDKHRIWGMFYMKKRLSRRAGRFSQKQIKRRASFGARIFAPKFAFGGQTRGVEGFGPQRNRQI